MEHKLVLGGEHWLPFARSRIKALRALGTHSLGQKFEMPDGATVAVSISGEHSFIRIEGSPGLIWIVLTYTEPLGLTVISNGNYDYSRPTRRLWVKVKSLRNARQAVVGVADDLSLTQADRTTYPNPRPAIPGSDPFGEIFIPHGADPLTYLTGTLSDWVVTSHVTDDRIASKAVAQVGGSYGGRVLRCLGPRVGDLADSYYYVNYSVTVTPGPVVDSVVVAGSIAATRNALDTVNAVVEFNRGVLFSTPVPSTESRTATVGPFPGAAIPPGSGLDDATITTYGGDVLAMVGAIPHPDDSGVTRSTAFFATYPNAAYTPGSPPTVAWKKFPLLAQGAIAVANSAPPATITSYGVTGLPTEYALPARNPLTDPPYTPFEALGLHQGHDFIERRVPLVVGAETRVYDRHMQLSATYNTTAGMKSLTRKLLVQNQPGQTVLNVVSVDALATPIVTIDLKTLSCLAADADIQAVLNYPQPAPDGNESNVLQGPGGVTLTVDVVPDVGSLFDPSAKWV